MFNAQLRQRSSLTTRLAMLAMGAAVSPLAAQQESVTTFINGVVTSINNVTANLPTGNRQPLIFGGQDFLAYGLGDHNWTPQEEIDYVDGLKAAGVQRVEFNPAVTTINNPADVANLDVAVRRVRELGMLLAINPEFNVGELTISTFSDFTNVAMQTYPALVARYQPDNFVIVHEPTTQAARMGISVTPAEWAQFVEQMEPIVKKAAPHTLVGAGDCSHCNEDAYAAAFIAIPNCNATTLSSGCTDFETDDDYSNSPADFAEVEGWIAASKAVNKPFYMEETFAPHYLPAGSSPGGYQSSPTGAEGASLIGSCNVIFQPMEQTWLAGMGLFDMAYGLESMTAFTTQTFFLYVDASPDQATNPTYIHEMVAAMVQGQLTQTATAYAGEVQLDGIKTVTSISNASYATLATIFNPACGTPDNPCNPNSTVAPDMIVSAFGADLANQTTMGNPSWPTTLGGTTATLVDTTNTSFAVPIYSVTPNQMNYLVPSNAAPGPANLTVTSGDATVTTGVVLVAPVAPGLYTSFATGQGPAAGIAVCAGTCSGWTNSLGNGQFWQYTFVPGCTSQNCAAPISWGASDSLVIELYGTGVRHLAALSDITANAAVGTGTSAVNTSLQVQFAGAQGTDTGLDQVNVAIPSSLHGAGTVNVSLAAQYTDSVTSINYTSPSNAVNLLLQ